MKKKDNERKLVLSRETLVRLDDPALHRAGGAGWSDDSVCPTTGPSRHQALCPRAGVGDTE